MPNIKTYEAPDLALRPTETGVEAQAATARRVGAFSNEVAAATQGLAGATRRLGQETGDLGDFRARLTTQTGARLGSAIHAAGEQIDKYETHKEISQGGAEFAKIHSDLTDQWNAAVKTTDPNNTSIAGEFREKTLEPALEKFREAFSTERGRNWAESHVQSLRNHFYQKTDADMATMAGQAVQVNTQRQRQSWSNTAYKDPSSVPYLLDQADKTIAGTIESSPALKGVAANKLRTDLTDQIKGEIINAGAHGALLNAPDPEKVAKTFSERWPQYVDAATLDRAAKTATRANRIDEERADRLAEKQAKQVSTLQRDEYIKDIFSDTPTVTAKSVLGDERLTPQDREHLIGVIRQQDRPEPAARVSRETWTELLGRIRATDDARLTDDTPIWNAAKAGQLTRTDFTDLLTRFKEARTPEGQRLTDAQRNLVHAVKPSIDKSNPLMGRMDQDGALNVYRFEFDLSQKIAEYRKAGKDPFDLFDPSKPDYFAKPDALQRYQKPLQESIADQTRRLTGRPAPSGTPSATPVPITQETPRKPGETAAQYLKRIGAE